MADGQPLSAGQQAMWFLHRLAPGSSAYNVVLAVRIKTALDLPGLRRAVHATARRHDMIRSSLTEVDGEPRRLVRDPGTVRLEVREVRGRDLFDAPIAEVCHVPFRLAAGEPPGRLVLFQRVPGDAVLALVVHHIATDATSQWMLLADLLAEYQQDGAGNAAAGSYDTYVEQEHRFLASPERLRLADVWRAECAGAVAAELPADQPRPDRQTFHGATCQRALSDDLAARARAAASSTGVTTFAFLLGIFASLLYRHSGQSDLTVGCMATNRRGRALRDIVGYLVNPIAVRIRLGDGHTFADAARLAHSRVATGLRHARYPFPVLVSDLDVPRRADRTPLFQITFSMIEASPLAPLSQLLPMTGPLGPEIEYAGLRLAQLDIPQMEGQFDLSVEVRQRGEALTLVFRYNTDIYTADTVDRLAHRYERLIEIATDGPGVRITDAPMLDEGEIRELLALGAGGE